MMDHGTKAILELERLRNKADEVIRASNYTEELPGLESLIVQSAIPKLTEIWSRFLDAAKALVEHERANSVVGQLEDYLESHQANIDAAKDATADGHFMKEPSLDVDIIRRILSGEVMS